ncbi:hypothetical protein [Holdemanella porci]|uniref:hypothetical protein n=1 Tax=Holdemanella porci TaxID=2652276 RepID=UPI003AF02BA6
MDFVTVSTGLILPYWMGLPIRYIHVIGDSFSEHMNDIMSLYFSEVHTVNVWSFTTDLLTEYQPDIVVWECAERYTDRFQWISLFG